MLVDTVDIQDSGKWTMGIFIDIYLFIDVFSSYGWGGSYSKSGFRGRVDENSSLYSGGATDDVVLRYDDEEGC